MKKQILTWISATLRADSALQTLLGGDGTVAGGRVYPAYYPELPSAPPYLTVDYADGDFENNHGPREGNERYEIAIIADIGATDMLSDVEDRIDALFREVYNPTVSGYKLSYVRVIGDDKTEDVVQRLSVLTLTVSCEYIFTL